MGLRWPWVSRLAFDMIDRENDRIRAYVERLEARISQLSEDYQALVGDVVEMKRDGFAAAPQFPNQGPAEEVHPLFADALDRIGLPGSLRAQMLGWAERQVAKGRQPDEVARELLAGGLATQETK